MQPNSYKDYPLEQSYYIIKNDVRFRINWLCYPEFLFQIYDKVFLYVKFLFGFFLQIIIKAEIRVVDMI